MIIILPFPSCPLWQKCSYLIQEQGRRNSGQRRADDQTKAVKSKQLFYTGLCTPAGTTVPGFVTGPPFKLKHCPQVGSRVPFCPPSSYSGCNKEHCVFQQSDLHAPCFYCISSSSTLQKLFGFFFPEDLRTLQYSELCLSRHACNCMCPCWSFKGRDRRASLPPGCSPPLASSTAPDQHEHSPLPCSTSRSEASQAKGNAAMETQTRLLSEPILYTLSSPQNDTTFK